jgi:hypothetical protein
MSGKQDGGGQLGIVCVNKMTKMLFFTSGKRGWVSKRGSGKGCSQKRWRREFFGVICM